MNETERADVAAMIRAAIREERTAHIADVRAVAAKHQEYSNDETSRADLRGIMLAISLAFSDYADTLEQRNTERQ